MRLTILALCAALTIPAFAAAPSQPSSAPPSATATMRRGMTPEEHFLYMQHLRGGDWRKLSAAQRCERAKKLREQRRDMSPAERGRLKQQLDAEWAKLPAAEKQRIEQRLAHREERHQQRRANGTPHAHRGGCADVPPAD